MKRHKVRFVIQGATKGAKGLSSQSVQPVCQARVDNLSGQNGNQDQRVSFIWQADYKYPFSFYCIFYFNILRCADSLKFPLQKSIYLLLFTSMHYTSVFTNSISCMQRSLSLGANCQTLHDSHFPRSCSKEILLLFHVCSE